VTPECPEPRVANDYLERSLSKVRSAHPSLPGIDDWDLQVFEVPDISRRKRRAARRGNSCNLPVAHIHWSPGFLPSGRETRSLHGCAPIEVRTLLSRSSAGTRSNAAATARCRFPTDISAIPKCASNSVMVVIQIDSAGCSSNYRAPISVRGFLHERGEHIRIQNYHRPVSKAWGLRPRSSGRLSPKPLP
jgi:hypothetical protein